MVQVSVLKSQFTEGVRHGRLSLDRPTRLLCSFFTARTAVAVAATAIGVSAPSSALPGRRILTQELSDPLIDGIELPEWRVRYIAAAVVARAQAQSSCVSTKTGQ